MRRSKPALAHDLDNAATSFELPVVLRFMQLLWRVVHGLDRASKRMTTDVGVTGPQRLVLRVVGLFPGVSAGELATIMHVHPSTLTGVLQRLTAQRLLKRVDDPSDRRRAVLRLSAAGERVNAATSGTVEHAVAAALRKVGDRDRAAAGRLLSRLADHLEPRAARTNQPRRERPRFDG